MKKRWIYLVLAVLFIWVVVSRFTEFQQLKTTLAQGQLAWLLAAFLVQIVYYVVFPGSYQAAFYTVNISSRIQDLLPVTLGSLFINVVVPSGGAGGAVLFTEDLSRRGKPAAGVAAGVLLQLIADFSSFLVILVPGLIFLSIEHDLKPYEIIAAVILLAVIAGLTGILILGISRPDRLQGLFQWTQRSAKWLFGRFHRSIALADDWAEKNSLEFTQAAEAVRQQPLRLACTVATAFLAHLLNILTIYLLFMAFNQRVTLGILVAGYAVGILFWVVSITPQGIGVVEGMMALAFTSLGIPGAVAATVALTFRGLTFWLPTLLGFFALQRTRTFSPREHSLSSVWGIRITALLVALMGLVNVLSAVTPSMAGRLAILRQYSPLEILHGGRLTAALAGFALLMLAGNLWRRKRVAWVLTLIALGISIVSHLVKGLDYEEASLAGVLMVVLWLMRSHFHARSDPPSIKQGLRVLAGAVLFTLIYGVGGFFLLDRHYSVNFGFFAALRQTVVMFTQFYDPGLIPITGFGRYFADSIYTVGAVTLSYAILMLLRPVFVRTLATAGEHAQAQAIVEKHGCSSLARFALFDDKRYFFSRGSTVVAYSLVGRTAVTLGDPIGPENDLAGAIEDFKALCQKNDWNPVFYQTAPRTLDLYRQAGFQSISIGQEGIVNLETFTLEGKEGKALRNPIHKLVNAGFTVKIIDPPLPDELLETLRDISDEWLTSMHGKEKRFSLGWFDDDYIRGSQVGVVYNPENWITAFANIVPEYQANELSLDLMRRRGEMVHGTMEFLFVSLFQWAKAQGYQSFNLGLSSLSGVGEEPGDPAAERLMHLVYEHVNQFYNFKGLHSFKEKFNPAWSPRYLIYTDAASLPAAWLAVVQANSGSRSLISEYLIKK